MNSWQGLLIYISAAAISLAVGSAVGLFAGRAVLRVWSRRKSVISTNNLNPGILKNKSQNQQSEVWMITAPAKSEKQTFSPAYLNKQSLSGQATILQSSPESRFEMKEVTREVKKEQEMVVRVPAEEAQFVSKEKRQMVEELEQRIQQETMTMIQGISQHMADLAESSRKYQEAKTVVHTEIKRLNREITQIHRGKDNQAPEEFGKEIKQKARATGKTKKPVMSNVNWQAESLNEIKTNLIIATTPWDGKPVSFQTKIWDTNISKFDLLTGERDSDLGQAYTDMAIANQIVWLYNEIGHKSVDLENSYKQLCARIAERLLRCAIRVMSLPIPEIKPSPRSLSGISS